MSKQPDVYEQREPGDSPSTPRHKEEGDDPHSGSYFDQVDMQRLGKEQELKVCRPYSQHFGRQCKSSLRSCYPEIHESAQLVLHTSEVMLTAAACIPLCIDSWTHVRDHGNLGDDFQHQHLLFDQWRQVRHSLVVHCNLGAHDSCICFTCGDGFDVGPTVLRPSNVLTSLTKTALSRAPSSGGQYHWYVFLTTLQMETILISSRVSEFAPPSMQKVLSYSSGYLAALGWQGYIAAASYMAGQQIFIAASVYNPEFVPERWQSCLFVSEKSIATR
jgi:hypothetical protein